MFIFISISTATNLTAPFVILNDETYTHIIYTCTHTSIYIIFILCNFALYLYSVPNTINVFTNINNALSTYFFFLFLCTYIERMFKIKITTGTAQFIWVWFKTSRVAHQQQKKNVLLLYSEKYSLRHPPSLRFICVHCQTSEIYRRRTSFETFFLNACQLFWFIRTNFSVMIYCVT
jgi:hypothetical protein